MSRRYYNGVVQDCIPMKSANKGTPGLEFKIDVDERKEGDSFQKITPITRTVWLYFPTDSEKAREISLRKLRRAGWPGGGLQDLDLIGKRVELQSDEEEYDGKIREKFDFVMGDFKSDRNEDAGNTIDAILRSAPVEAGQSAQPALASASKAPVDDDEVPF